MKTATKLIFIANIVMAIITNEFQAVFGWIAALFLISDKDYKIYKNS